MSESANNLIAIPGHVSKARLRGVWLDIFNAVAYLASLVAILFCSELSVSDKVLYLFALGYCGILSGFVLVYMRHIADKLLFGLTAIIIGYFTLAFVVKLAYAIYFPELLWSATGDMHLSPVWIRANLFHPTLIFLVGYTALLVSISVVGTFTGKVGRHLALDEGRKLTWLFWLVIFLLALKFVLLHVFQIGVPGLAGNELFIPNLAGLLNMLTTLGLFYLVNLGICQALRTGYGRWVFAFLVFAAVYVGIELLFGIKRSLIFEPFVLFWLLTTGRGQISRNLLRRVIVVTVLFLSVALLTYKYVNYYRAAFIRGSDTVSALNSALQSQNASERNGATMLMNRVIGVDYAEAAINAPIAKMQWGDPLTADLMHGFTVDVAGSSNVVWGIGITQVARWYILGGYLGTFIAFIWIGVIFSLLYVWCTRRLGVCLATRATLTPVLGIAYIEFLMSGGDPVLIAKQLIVTLSMAYVGDRVLRSRKNAGMSRALQHGTIQ